MPGPGSVPSFDEPEAQADTGYSMFKRLLQALARGVAAPVIIQNELRDLLGADAAAEVQALQENRLHDEALKKRATGLVALGRVIVSTRGQMKDPDRHRFLWHEIALPVDEVHLGRLAFALGINLAAG